VSQESCLRTFLSLPGVFNEICSYLREPLIPDNIADFKDGSLWRQHPLRVQHVDSDQVVVIPVFDFFDDVEVANPLGSHATIHKIGAKYTIIKGCRPFHNSKLENILLNTLINSSDRCSYSNADVFDAYLTEMHKLATEGFELTLNGIDYRVYVVLVQVACDNLGLNGVLGYAESFTARYPCRICKADRDSFTKRFTEDKSLMRTRENYTLDVQQGNSSLTGVKEVCSYNALKFFHVVDNVYCDIMHDLFEGVCRYVVSKLLKYLIFEKKYFDIASLSRRMQFFTYDHSSIPQCLRVNHIQAENINMGAVRNAQPCAGA
jgi:hypothetical protein